MHYHARAWTGLVTRLADPIITSNWLTCRGTLRATAPVFDCWAKPPRNAERTDRESQAQDNGRLSKCGHKKSPVAPIYVGINMYELYMRLCFDPS
jgi:hypothetical protein